ncbi:MAG: ABC transporter ATP-binding protein [Actinomycetes bacterium]
MSAPLLEIKNLTTVFESPRGPIQAARRVPRVSVRAVDDVSFTVNSGELVALVGESGSGKTTTAQSLLQMIPSSGGQVLFKGEDVSKLSGGDLRALRRHMQVVYQDPYESLDPRYTVRRTVEEPLIIHGLGGSKAERAAVVEAALERVGLTPPDLFLDRYPHQMSGGQRQRVSIATALTLEPELLVADEPVSMLDVSVRAGVLELLDDLRDSGLGILMITHDLSTAAKYADRIAVMYLGRIVEIGSAREVTRDPRHPYTQALLSVVPTPARAGMKRQVLKGETPNAANIPSGCRFHPRCPVAVEACSTTDPALEVVPPGGASPGAVSGQTPGPLAVHEAACLRLADLRP